MNRPGSPPATTYARMLIVASRNFVRRQPAASVAQRDGQVSSSRVLSTAPVAPTAPMA